MAHRPRRPISWLLNPFQNPFRRQTNSGTTRQKRQRPEPIPRKPEPTVIIDGETGQIIEEGSPPELITHLPAEKDPIYKKLPPNLPKDIVQLAAQNAAFLQGILALQELNLDQDLFLEAIEDLRRKYYRERNNVKSHAEKQLQEVDPNTEI
ncbi:MAG TPA: hypothetical protein VN207_05940 [Ktedonobacteraceae bacterium]|nr:hypothetical protein [Ktedonobacteraceae bacterium]